MGYLSAEVCPLRGREFVRCLLPRRCVSTDEEVLELSNALINTGWPEEAKSVLLCRGMWWWNKYSEMSFSDEKRKSVCSVLIGKAVQFFALAGEMSMVSRMLEVCWQRLLWTVIDNNPAFPGLSFAFQPLSSNVLHELNTKQKYLSWCLLYFCN
jgi:hypothetical protein